jgi:hypothetical protein
MKTSLLLLVGVTAFLLAWLVWADLRDSWRQQMAEQRLSKECMGNLSEIHKMLIDYRREHGEFPTNLLYFLKYGRGNDFAFRCRLCYDLDQTVFSLPELSSERSDFRTVERFDRFSYAYVLEANSTNDPDGLWVFCVGLHPDVHVLLRGGQVKAVPTADFLRSYMRLARSNVIYPTNIWAASEVK